MAYIHVRAAQNSQYCSDSFRIDGGVEIFFDYGKYVEVESGLHVVTVSNNIMAWNVQEELGPNDVLEVVLTIGHEGVICAPQYYVKRDPDARTLEIIKESMEDDKEREERKWANAKRTFRKIRNICLFLGFLPMAIVSWYMGLTQVANGNTAVGSVFVLVGAVITGVLFGVGIHKLTQKK